MKTESAESLLFVLWKLSEREDGRGGWASSRGPRQRQKHKNPRIFFRYSSLNLSSAKASVRYITFKSTRTKRGIECYVRRVATKYASLPS